MPPSFVGRKMGNMRRFLCIVLPVIALVGAAASGVRGTTAQAPAASGPAPQGTVIAGDIATYSGAYWARVAGRDTGKPPQVNGHDEFQSHWKAAALAALHGLHATAFLQDFKTPGFQGLPARKPGVNVIVTVPGRLHPNEAVVVGTHYDVEPTSKGSAFDDTSGSMILLALARSMGNVWRQNGLPSTTVEFVLFDAEEEGLVGSVAYAFAQRHHALLPKTVMMIDEEQSGIGYPVRPFGLLSEDVLPTE